MWNQRILHRSALMRNPHNPIIDPSRIEASSPDLEVVGVFNAGVAAIDEEIVLLLRVAEAPRDIPPSEIAAPVLEDGRIVIRRWSRAELADVGTDSRVFHADGELYLTSISHLRT